MKKILLLIIALLPFLGIGQTTFASWSLDGTTAATSQSYITPTNFALGDDGNFSGVYTSDGVALGRWSNGNYDNDRYIEVSIAATTGNYVNINEFNFKYKNNSNGPTRATIKYLILNSGDATPSDSNFLSNADTFTGWTDNTLNTSNTTQTVSVGLNLYLQPTQRIVVRFYGRDANNNSRNFTFLKDSLNFKGCKTEGDPSVYGTDTWIGYVYQSDGATPNAAPVNYLGYVTENFAFNRNIGSGNIVGATTQLCSIISDLFFVRYRAKVNVSGKFDVTVGGDDGYRFSIDGGATWLINKWELQTYNTTTTSVCLNGETDLVLEYYENQGQSQISFSFVDVTPVAPTSITGTNTICSGTSTTLTANGTTVDGVNTFYQWGTGTVGTNIIAGATSSTYTTPNLTSNTTYWVRVTSPGTCVFNTAAATSDVVVTPQAVIPTSLTTPNATICSGTQITLTANGTSGTYQWGTGATVGSNIIPNQSASTLVVSPTASTTYWVRVLATSPCTTNSGGRTLVITVSAVPPVNPTSITGITTICTGTGTTLTATPGLGTYQWGTGTTIGSNPIAGQTTNTLTTGNLTSTTNYWVRVVGTAPCVSSAGITTTVTVIPQAVIPTSLTTPNTTICSGTQITLTANGTSGTYQWGTGATVGSNIIPNESASTLVVSPTATTTYWVRVLATSPCTTNSGGRTLAITVSGFPPVNPTSITGITTICTGTGTTLTATAGLGTYQWGTGSTVGSNIIAGQTTNTLNTGNLTSTTNYWVRVVGSVACGNSPGITTMVTVIPQATRPTSITSTSTNICSGTQITLTANGTYTSGTYQWGTGTVPNNVIAGETGNTLVVSPTANTTYWVRILAASPCTTNTLERTLSITVAQAATDPTSITGADSFCPGSAVLLTASGGSGATFQWGTGAIGSNVIAGQTASTITVNPTVNTTYWVRRQNNLAPCTGFTGGVTKLVTVGVPGAPADFGNNEWNVFGYTGGGNSNPTGYSGFYTQNLGSNVGMDTKLKWGVLTSPSSAPDWNGCTISANTSFTFIHKRRGFPCGNYLLSYTYYDDETTIIITDANGVTSTINSTGFYNGGAGLSQAVNGTTTYALDANSTIEIRTTNSGVGESKLGIIFTPNAYTPPVAPTTITGINSICSGTSTTLTATAGLGTYQWGTGATVGSNPIAGTTNTITVSPTSTTTYWVRVRGTFPCPDSAGITYAVTVTAPPVAPTAITGTNSICSGTSTTLTASAGLGTYEWGTGATVGSNIIAGATTNTYTTANLNSTTTYWVRVKGTSPCGDSAGITRTVTVTPSATAPTAITGVETSYCPSGPVTLTATGGTGSTYEWGTGSVVGTNPIAGQTSASIIVNPSTTTTYWVRRSSVSPCSGVTSGVIKTITVLPTPGDPAEFGTNEWNVYAYNSGGNSNPSDYRGYYVQNLGSNVGIDTKLKWDPSTSPSAALDWQGCAVNNDGFTMIHKRRGFPCGRYSLAFLYYDEDTVVIIKDANGTTSTLNFTGLYNGGSGLSQAINGGISYALDANSTVEIRTTDITASSEAKLGITFTAAGPAVYSNGAWEAGANPSYVDITLNDNFLLPADLTVCTCTINNGFTATVPENLTLTVIGNAVALGTGKYIIENTGAFVQVNDNSTYTGVPSSFTSKRKTQPTFRFDFTYWSSPVEDFVLKNVSPITLFDKFFSWNSATQVWLSHKSNLAPNLLEVMGTGKGYSVRAPQNFNVEGSSGAIAKIHEAVFVGKPHTGTKSTTVSNGAANRWNLIGNPYPSAISVAKFLDLNKNVVDGTLYFWTHKSPVIQNSPNPDYAVYSSTDYVAVNLSGNISNGTESGAVSSAPTGNSLGLGAGSPFDNIASGQSFFIKGKETAPTGTQVTFNNAMRVRIGGKNNQFFKPGVTTPVKDWQLKGKHRIWLNMTSAQNDFHQTLVGYIQEATDGLDWGYDGEVFSGGAVTLYSLLNTKALTIQARALPFSAQDIVPLGYTTTRTGMMRISIDHVDGLFSGQGIYLEDKILNVVHNLKSGSYSFTTVPGTFNERFVLRYVPQDNLGTDPTILDANSIVIFNNNNQISIKAKELTIDKVIIYDIQGRVLLSKNNINAQEFITNSLTANNQVVLVKVITESKAEMVKKVILK